MIDKIEDNSKEEAWKLARKGKFTASASHRLLAKGKGEVFGAGAMSYINEVACDAYTTFSDDGYEIYDMKMGKIMEPEIAAHYETAWGIEITNLYGATNPHFEPDPYFPKDSGGSPDGIIRNNHGSISWGVEFKRPKKLTHWSYLTNIKDQWDLKRLSEDGEKLKWADKLNSVASYYSQVQKLMNIFKCDLWHWCSYNEYFPIRDRLLVIEIKPDKPFIDDLNVRVGIGIKRKYELLDRRKNPTM